MVQRSMLLAPQLLPLRRRTTMSTMVQTLQQASRILQLSQALQRLPLEQPWKKLPPLPVERGSAQLSQQAPDRRLSQPAAPRLRL